MAEIQANVLEKLKCAECDCYLSCSPVYLKTDGGSVCGRCPLPDSPMARNEPYEQLAALMVFPCRYQQHGCLKKLPIKEIKQHEDTCKFHPIICPMSPSGSCEWVGPAQQLLKHCKAKHPQQVLQNPSTLQHSITTNSFNTYLMSVFQVLFLIHTKVCLATRKIWYSVRLLGGLKRNRQYCYEVEIRNSDTQIKKQGIVARQGCLALQEDSALAIDINSLIGILGGFDGATFKITLNGLLQRCVKCKKDVADIVYRTVEGGHCETCSPAIILCENSNRGCTYTDIAVKVDKHLKYFCKYASQCPICCVGMTVSESLEEHCRREHSDVTHGAGVKWPATIAPGIGRYHIVTCDVGVLVCWYGLLSSQFRFYVRSPLRNIELSAYSCELCMIDPVSGRYLHRILDVQYNEYHDWTRQISEDILSEVMADELCDVKILFRKKVSMS